MPLRAAISSRRIGCPTRTLALAPRAHLQEIAYDDANRAVTESAGVTSTGLQRAGGTSIVTSVWDKRGAVSACNGMRRE